MHFRLCQTFYWIILISIMYPPLLTATRGERILDGIIRDEVFEESRMAEAAPVAKSKTPTAGFVTVPTIPFVNPVKSPYNFS